jgi:hypothetical protein
MSRLSLGLTLAVAAPLLACGSTPGVATVSTSGTLTVHGTLPPTTKALDNARAVALGADGHTYAAYLNRAGQFTLNLPVGHAYLIAFTNSRLDGREAVIGHLVLHTSSGARSFLGARAPGHIELGAISPVRGASVATQGATDLKIACGCSGGDDEGEGYQGGGGGQGGGDYGCHENDGECNSVCDDGEDDDMQCEQDPGDDCESDDLDDDGGKSTCEQHTQQSCDDGGSSSSGYGSSGGGGGYTDDSGAPSSGGCQVSAQCGSGQVCCGAACQD